MSNHDKEVFDSFAHLLNLKGKESILKAADSYTDAIGENNLLYADLDDTNFNGNASRRLSV